MTNNRMIVLGSRREMELFRESKWERRLRARYCEMMEWSKRRCIADFKTEAIPIEPLRKLSRRWPQLTFVIFYEIQRVKVMAIVKAKAGETEHHEINY